MHITQSTSKSKCICESCANIFNCEKLHNIGKMQFCSDYVDANQADVICPNCGAGLAVIDVK